MCSQIILGYHFEKILLIHTKTSDNIIQAQIRL